MTDSSKPTLLIQYHSMALALPLNVGLTLPVYCADSSCPPGPVSLENHSEKRTQETAEPFEFSPAEPVDYG